MHVIIIGAGLGGLATALRLGHIGYKVTILEKQNQIGGRSNVIEQNGFRVDTGPTILVMKSTFDELYQSIGEDINQRLTFIQLDPNYRIYYHDNTHLDLFSNMALLAQEVERIEAGSAERLFRFLGDSAKKYELGMDFVDRNYNKITDLANPVAGVRLLKTNAHQKLYKQVSAYFNGNDKLSKALSFHSMFLGLSPYDALAMYSLITYADLALGMWYPLGGIYSIVEDIKNLLNSMNVDIYTNTLVEEIIISGNNATGVMLADGTQIDADIVVSNADLPYTYHHLIPGEHRKRYTDKKLASMSYACSGYLLYLGINKTYPNMRHQALFFAEDYHANLNAIFSTKTLPEDPSFHLNNASITDPGLAPPGHNLLYILAPMPNLQANIDWDEAAPIMREKLIDRLERIIDPEIRQHIVWEKEYKPTNFLSDFNSTLGTAFGSLSQAFFQSAYFRPHNVDRDINRLYFVGQGTYPGIGMPMVIISSRLVTERITKEWSL